MQYVTNTLAGLTELEEALEVLRSMVQGAGLIDGVSMERLGDASEDRLMLANGKQRWLEAG
ncbi:hypothetical protein PISMIDRAFT_9869 [Pisolithus microcarpus 441]|uniref:Uncharacterized protein n=1 Tax=Pisolithus microcarpus 441 TaxID=765257 RepID=A0A0C9ZGH8_9AGAM|nr:hypothetical protein PISMIDRAFT_9869 [Pisolithus microcarpus 441]